MTEERSDREIIEWLGGSVCFHVHGKGVGYLCEYCNKDVGMMINHPTLTLEFMVEKLGERGDLILIQQLSSKEWHVDITFGIDTFGNYDHQVNCKEATLEQALKQTIIKLMEEETEEEE